MRRGEAEEWERRKEWRGKGVCFDVICKSVHTTSRIVFFFLRGIRTVKLSFTF
jgi:hypothetical protein